MSIFLRVSCSPSYLFLSMIVAINFSILMTHYFLIVRDGAYSYSDNARKKHSIHRRKHCSVSKCHLCDEFCNLCTKDIIMMEWRLMRAIWVFRIALFTLVKPKELRLTFNINTWAGLFEDWLIFGGLPNPCYPEVVQEKQKNTPEEKNEPCLS